MRRWNSQKEESPVGRRNSEQKTNVCYARLDIQVVWPKLEKYNREQIHRILMKINCTFLV